MATPNNTWQILIARIRKHVSNGYPNDAFATTDNEIYFYISQSMAQQIKNSAYENAKVEGVLVIPEAYLITYQITGILQNIFTKAWYVTLPQPPLSLPLGYSITRVYFPSQANGQGQDAFPIKAKRIGYRMNMPKPTGVNYWVEGSTLWLQSYNNAPLNGITVFVQMPATRQTDLTQNMNIPDDVVENIFNDVVIQLIKRYQMPKDVINDDLPSGNTNLNSQTPLVR